MVFRDANEAISAGQPGGGSSQSLFGNTRDRATRQHEMYLQALQSRQAPQQPSNEYYRPTRMAGGGGSLQDYARQRLAAMGLSDPGEFDALYRLWQKESNWNPNAVNPSSGAWGIAQTLPSAHPNVRRNNDGRAQIDWGLQYILGRYGRPSRAWQHSQRTNWY